MARILVTGFCSYPAPDRPGVQLGHVIDGLSREHQVDVLAVRRMDQAHVERHGSCRILRVPIADDDLSTRIDSFRRALRRQLEGAQYDVVHFRDGWTGVTALELQAQHNYATVFDLARSPMAEPMLTDLATATELERAELTCVRRANLILAPSEAAQRYLSGLTDESKIHVVPVGVNVDELDWEHGVPGGAPLVLYLGSLTAGRGVRVLLRAMLDVAAASKAVLVLGGPASQTFTKSLTRAVTDFHLTGRVRLLGEVPRSMVASVISKATVCVAPGAAELEAKSAALYPTKILEYMACKRAVVAPRRGTVEMLMRDERHGLLFQPGDPSDLADKLLALIHGPALRDRVAEAGYQLVRQNYTASATRRRLRGAYLWLAQQDAFRESFARDRDEDSVTSSITDLGVDLHLGGPGQEQDLHYEGETLLLDGEAAPAGDVTRVEVNPLHESNAKLPAGATRSDTEMPTLEHEGLGQDEGTDQWVPPRSAEAVNAEQSEGSDEDLEFQQPKTVITAPMDQSLVAGELRSRTPRPELLRPVGELGGPLNSPPSIPPAPRAPLPFSQRPSAMAERKADHRNVDHRNVDEGEVDDNAMTKIVASPLAMIENAMADEEGAKTAVVSALEVEKLAPGAPQSPRAAPGPNAPKLPTRGTALPALSRAAPPPPSTASPAPSAKAAAGHESSPPDDKRS